ncbi:MFS transporter, DHA2 family, multidrug resistance protein [Luteibacter sp. UNCMF331Sha3.1]|uniref:DHA2 family efflux MFS transporter permease subunit n=1 Tax=Luteibacter sp. UNCMF331Sha3.1 TaxID=1502760 RepID=UPI0008BEE1C9|nr:DHA2 family efflux MFS transporter permease subunit [Luteibacter sp. UNCMF331Sha3.1]SEM53486.1 MFS transporter, DHA2 family, multidrug resistance protein [Luteibacter sp. UNCMF331Sha3.1]
MTGAADNHRDPDRSQTGMLVVATLLATFMQAVNISIPNAALLHMQGTLSMSDDQVGWIFSSYLTAGALVMPVAQWLGARFGRKRVLLVSLGVFAVALILVTRATTPLGFVYARILQGAASGTLGPLSLAILLDILPPRRHARTGMVWTVTSLAGMLSGPGIGGWLSEYHGWPSIFRVSLPLTAVIMLALALFLPEKKAAQRPTFDFFGLATFSMGVAGLQMMLDRGERLEWSASPEIWIEGLAALLGMYLFVVHIATREKHFLDKALFRDRNFGLSTIIFFAVGFVLLPTLALTSPMLMEIFRYPADTTGFLMIPRGVALIGALLLAWHAPARLDPRVLFLTGAGLAVYGTWRMLDYSPQMHWNVVVLAGVLQGAGLGLTMPGLTRAAFSTLEPSLRPEGTLLFNLSRLYGSTIGIAIVQIFFFGNTQSMHLALAQHLHPYGAARSSSGAALASLNELVTGQAALIAVIGQFKLLMLALLLVTPLALFLHHPRAAVDTRRSSP